MTVYHARDVSAALENDPSAAVEVDLKCVIISRSKQKRFLFLSVQDDSGVIQVVVDKDYIADAIWKTANGLRIGEGALVTGHVTTEFKRPGVKASAVLPVSQDDVAQDIGRRPVDAGSTITQAYVARLERILREFLEQAGFIEIAPRMISSVPPATPCVSTLRVLYDGYGAAFHITPSPAPQLVQALASTSYSRVFAVSRCFTLGYRDPVVGVESVIVTSAQRKASIRDALGDADRMLRKLFLRQETRSSKNLAWPPTTTVELGSLGGEASAAVNAPQIQIFTNVESDGHATEIGRLCWPLAAEHKSDFSEYILAEGYTAGEAATPAFALVTINISRLLALIVEQVELRRIPALEFPPIPPRGASA